MPSVRYSLTITLRPQLYKYKPEEQYDKSHLEVAKTLKALGSTVTLIAEVTKSYNIHMHGVIQFDQSNNCLKKLYDIFRTDKLVGYIMCKQIDNEPGWIEYISKDLLSTKEIINRPPIIINEFEFNLSTDTFMNCFELIDEQ